MRREEIERWRCTQEAWKTVTGLGRRDPGWGRGSVCLIWNKLEKGWAGQACQSNGLPSFFSQLVCWRRWHQATTPVPSSPGPVPGPSLEPRLPSPRVRPLRLRAKVPLYLPGPPSPRPVVTFALPVAPVAPAGPPVGRPVPFCDPNDCPGGSAAHGSPLPLARPQVPPPSTSPRQVPRTQHGTQPRPRRA